MLKNYLIDCVGYSEEDLSYYPNYKDLHNLIDEQPKAIEACKAFSGLPNKFDN